MNNESYENMLKRHDQEISELQSKCVHEKISDWTPYYWAPGHYGYEVKVCLWCGAIQAKDPEPEESVFNDQT